ncbi:MAG: 50S ribosomal protein L7/L12, partial [Deltaproteobacteria bacterium]
RQMEQSRVKHVPVDWEDVLGRIAAHDIRDPETGDKKIQVIKVVRELTGLGLKKAKDLVDDAPKPIKEGVAKAEAEAIKKKIEEVGGKVDIK